MMTQPQLLAVIAAAEGLLDKVRGTDICSFAKLLTTSLHPGGRFEDDRKMPWERTASDKALQQCVVSF